MLIREYGGFGFDKSNLEHNQPITDISFKESNISGNIVNASSLMVDIEGIHAYPYATRNFTRYMPECLANSVPSWTKPYRRPLIKHHNERDGEIIGRIHNALYVTENTISGTPTLLFTANIPEKSAKEEIEDGRLETVSIGVIAHDVRCSICGHQIATEGECPDHERGNVYDGEVCYWDIYSMEAKELSYVIVPSDIYAKNVQIYKAQINKNPAITECLDNKGGKQNMNEQEKTELENQINALKTEKTALETKVSALEEAKKALEANVAELAAAKTTLEGEKAALAAEKIALTTAKTTAEAAALSEKGLRETAEQQCLELKNKVRESLVESLQTVRKLSGKAELTEDALKTRTEESIKDAIADLKEELTSKLPEPGSIVSPVLTEKTKQNGKNKEDLGNVDLTEGLENLFTFVTNAYK